MINFAVFIYHILNLNPSFGNMYLIQKVNSITLYYKMIFLAQIEWINVLPT